MAMQTPEQLVHGGGGLAASGLKDTLCKAFALAVEEQCSKPVGERGSFNNKFYEKLRQIDPSLAGRIEREVPIVFGKVAEASDDVAMVMGRASELTNAPGVVGAMANAIQAAYQSGVREFAGAGAIAVTGATANRAIPGGPWAVVGAAAWATIPAAALSKRVGFGLQRLFNRGARVKFPDGLIGNQVIEIKGPGDTMSNGQAKDYQAFSRPDPPIVPSCESCGTTQCSNAKNAKRKNGGCT